MNGTEKLAQWCDEKAEAFRAEQVSRLNEADRQRSQQSAMHWVKMAELSGKAAEPYESIATLLRSLISRAGVKP